MALPLIEELSPPPDPWATARQLADLPHLLFLDSADREAPAELNRYSFLTADPVKSIESYSDTSGRDTFDPLQRWLTQHHVEPCGVPFPGGVAGLFGYGLGRCFENLPQSRIDEFQVPDLAVGLYDWVIGWDHQTGRAWIVST